MQMFKKWAFFFTLIITSLWSENNKVVATIAVGKNPEGIAITPDSSFAYIANSNQDSTAGEDSVSVLNLANKSLELTIRDASFKAPYRIAIHPDGTRAYVANSGSTTLSIIDTTTNHVIGTINGFDGPAGIVITPDGNYAYVNNYGRAEGVESEKATAVRVVDLQTNEIIGEPIVVDRAPSSMAITPDGKYVYVTCDVNGEIGAGILRIIRTSDHTVLPKTITGFSGPFTIAITPNGKYAYVTNFGSNNFAPVGTTVSVIDIKRNAVIKTLSVGSQPSGLAISPNGAVCYITNYNTVYKGPHYTNLTASQGTVRMIDLQNNLVLPKTIQVGFSPGSIVISPNGDWACVTNYTSNTVSIIELHGGIP